MFAFAIVAMTTTASAQESLFIIDGAISSLEIVKQIAKDMRSAMILASAADEQSDILPEDIRRRHSLCTLSYAMRNIHTPDSYSALAAAKKRLIFDEFFTFALGITAAGAESKRAPAHPCAASDPRPLEAVLPYSLTGAQRRVIGEIREDMAKDTAMSRMVIGDVGSGKTVCAAAAMLFAVQNGRQAALMAPTEILARQHYASLKEIFASLGMTVGLLVGATPAAEKRKIYASLASSGEDRLDIIIGTHALISSGVQFASPGVVVIDEQHRFGVGQRAALAEKNPMSHVLVMSATPIPRSLALALYGDLDISTIDEIPPGRQRVDTFVVDESYRERLNGFIKKQVKTARSAAIIRTGLLPRNRLIFVIKTSQKIQPLQYTPKIKKVKRFPGKSYKGRSGRVHPL